MHTFLMVAVVLGAGKVDPKLVGTWQVAGAPFMTLDASGAGTMEGDRIRWKTEGTTLVLSDEEGGEDRASYTLTGDGLTLSMNGIAIQLTRAGKGEAVKKKGKLSKKLEAAEAEVDDDAVDQLPARRVQPVSPPPQPGPPARAGADQLSQLLLSSNWCYLRYASGNTYTQKVHFSPDGTWSDASESDIYVSNSMGMAEANNRRQNGGQWVVRQGQLLLSNPPESPQLAPIGLTITRNSNGYPILNADGREYSMCR